MKENDRLTDGEEMESTESFDTNELSAVKAFVLLGILTVVLLVIFALSITKTIPNYVTAIISVGVIVALIIIKIIVSKRNS